MAIYIAQKSQPPGTKGPSGHQAGTGGAGVQTATVRVGELTISASGVGPVIAAASTVS